MNISEIVPAGDAGRVLAGLYDSPTTLGRPEASIKIKFEGKSIDEPRDNPHALEFAFDKDAA